MNYYQRTLTALGEAGVEFVVIGGVAITAHGSAYVTFDLDVCYERSRANIQRLVDALAPYHPRLRGAPPDLPFHFDAPTVSRGLNYTLTTDLGDLDLLGEVQGIGFYNDVLARSTTTELFGRTWHVLTLEGLIASKRAAGRPRDLAVIPELEALRELETLKSADATAPEKAKKESRQSRPKRKGSKRLGQ